MHDDRVFRIAFSPSSERVCACDDSFSLQIHILSVLAWSSRHHACPEPLTTALEFASSSFVQMMVLGHWADPPHFESKSVTDTRATTDKNDPFLNVGFKHGWVDKMGQNATWGSGV